MTTHAEWVQRLAHHAPRSRVARWRPLAHPPRHLWVACFDCGYSSLNEDQALRGWQETVATPRLFRCDECAERECAA